MNRAALNAIAINDSIRVRLLLEADIVTNASLPITYGMGLGATANVRVQGAGEAYKRSYASAGADTVIDADLESHAVTAAMGEGLASIVTQGDLDAFLRLQPIGSADILFQAEADEHVTPAINGQGAMSIEFDGELIPFIREAPNGAGHARIRLEIRLAPHVGRSGMVSSTAEIMTSSRMRASLRMVAGGHAIVEFTGDGASRMGGRLHGSGKADIALMARGQSDLWHHIHGSGAAEIEIQLKAERHGFPPIPSIYVPARPDWRFTVPYENWSFTVPRDDWGQR